MSHKVNLLKKGKRSSIQQNWMHLCNLLGAFGVDNKQNELTLNWNSPDTNQFEFLQNLMCKITNNNVKGSYDEFTGNWQVKA
ncbi:MAG: hypothetical protein ACW98A_13835 [Candidatus Hodarchaeales archaeon]